MDPTACGLFILRSLPLQHRMKTRHSSGHTHYQTHLDLASSHGCWERAVATELKLENFSPLVAETTTYSRGEVHRNPGTGLWTNTAATDQASGFAHGATKGCAYLQPKVPSIVGSYFFHPPWRHYGSTNHTQKRHRLLGQVAQGNRKPHLTAFLLSPVL